MRQLLNSIEKAHEVRRLRVDEELTWRAWARPSRLGGWPESARAISSRWGQQSVTLLPSCWAKTQTANPGIDLVAPKCRTRTVREPAALRNEQRLRSEQYVVADRVSLKAALDREGIAPSSYSLDGDDLENRYVLAIRPGGWAVFFYARGREMDRAEFETEDEACSELLLRVLGDPTTRIR